jgi:hypothetical protein
MAPDADVRAPGGAITVELCGSWEHEPPCRLAPHHSSARRIGEEVRVRTLFAAEPGTEEAIRRRIETALRRGVVTGPDGVTTRWDLIGSGATAVLSEESVQAERLAGG